MSNVTVQGSWTDPSGKMDCVCAGFIGDQKVPWRFRVRFRGLELIVTALFKSKSEFECLDAKVITRNIFSNKPRLKVIDNVAFCLSLIHI